ncbi:MAG TPA: hypothetical protein VN773_02120 [Verrucomicrobiae bacterium]|nr:hypothetical protein [Verrucomicrobiae bacterium]
MSADRDVTRIVRSWLEEGATALPDRVLDTVLDQLPATPQRRAAWPARRFLSMDIPARLAATAAVALVAVIGAIAIPKGGGISAPGASPHPTPTPTPTPSPMALPLNPQELMVTEPGTFLAGDPFQIPITMNVPAGWVGKVGGPYAAYLDRAPVGNGDAYIEITLSQTIYADPCHDRGFLAPQPGPTVDDLAAALARQPGFVATTPTEITVDGYSGKVLTLTAPASFDACTLSPDGYRLWRLPLGGIFAFNPGQHATLRIVDVDGKRLVISSDTFPTTNAQELAETQAIVDSIRIAKTN